LFFAISQPAFAVDQDRAFLQALSLPVQPASIDDRREA
jgi:hypothetical protein